MCNTFSCYAFLLFDGRHLDAPTVQLCKTIAQVFAGQSCADFVFLTHRYQRVPVSHDILNDVICRGDGALCLLELLRVIRCAVGCAGECATKESHYILFNKSHGESMCKTNGYPSRIIVAPFMWASRFASRCMTYANRFSSTQ